MKNYRVFHNGIEKPFLTWDDLTPKERRQFSVWAPPWVMMPETREFRGAAAEQEFAALGRAHVLTMLRDHHRQTALTRRTGGIPMVGFCGSDRDGIDGMATLSWEGVLFLRVTTKTGKSPENEACCLFTLPMPEFTRAE